MSRVVIVSSESVSINTSDAVKGVMAAGTASRNGWRLAIPERARMLKSSGAAVRGYGPSAEFAGYGDAELASIAVRPGSSV